MSTLTFKDFLSIVNEDAAADVMKLQAEIGAVDAQLNQRTQPLMQRKQQLQKLLMIKQKQQQAEQAKAGNTATDPNAQQAQAGNATTTPGGTGSGTPGGQPSSSGM